MSVKSLCIGCDFNKMVPWLDGYAGFPPTNFVCDNTKSTDYGECIIGHLGCEHTTTKDRELPPPVLDIDYDYTEHGMLRYRHKCANGCGSSDWGIFLSNIFLENIFRWTTIMIIGFLIGWGINVLWRKRK